ncbi:MAG: S-methyl-5'-thioadenosine phosphorylase [Candidatus Bathyarchaeota archaeon]|nr:MAG: S-methyl-5'-thioadenosine phosphorylase [Candidatus Bathyarchaeota archaeon]
MAIIGGTGLEDLLGEAEQILIETPYGLPPSISIGEIDGNPLAFLRRHGVRHSIPPHSVNYQANIYALHQMGVKRIIATNAVGAINTKFGPGDLAVPHDMVDFTKSRRFTFYDDAPVTHIDVSQPYCPEIRRILVETAKGAGIRAWNRAVLVCTEGPRYETPAEIEMFRRLGCDVVGMTGAPEAVLARELEMCYATLCLVSNMAAGMQKRLTAREVTSVAGARLPIIQRILRTAIKKLPENRDCPCSCALEDARLRRLNDARSSTF